MIEKSLSFRETDKFMTKLLTEKKGTEMKMFKASEKKDRTGLTKCKETETVWKFWTSVFVKEPNKSLVYCDKE